MLNVYVGAGPAICPSYEGGDMQNQVIEEVVSKNLSLIFKVSRSSLKKCRIQFSKRYSYFDTSVLETAKFVLEVLN